MDGVLVDLLEGYRNIHPENKCLTDMHNDGDEKWDVAKPVNGFWATLPKMPDVDLLLDFFQNLVKPEKLFVLSARQHLFPKCDEEKVLWLINNAPVFNITQARIVNRKEKIQYAVQDDGTQNILVDDYEKNIKEWTNAGGFGILHTSADSTIDQLLQVV